jgi:hypothetical protein
LFLKIVFRVGGWIHPNIRPATRREMRCCVAVGIRGVVGPEHQLGNLRGCFVFETQFSKTKPFPNLKTTQAGNPNPGAPTKQHYQKRRRRVTKLEVPPPNAPRTKCNFQKRRGQVATHTSFTNDAGG